MPAASQNLSSLLPPAGGSLSADSVLSGFVGYAAHLGLELYPAQEEAVLHLLEGRHVVLSTPTGSGKSLVAMALHFLATAQGKRSYYTCPIKALVNEKFFALCDAFGPDRVGLVTGDASINTRAPIICCTAEILAKVALRPEAADVGYVVMDEFHYYADRSRGVAWQLPLLTMPHTVFLLMSATLGDMQAITERLSELTGREVAEVKSAQRPVPLSFSWADTPLHETLSGLLSRGRAPVYLVNFTQRAAVEEAWSLLSVDFSTKEEKEKLRQALVDARFDTPFGKDLSRLLKHGVGVHHAGLLPKYRRLVERLAQAGLLKIISGTDTLGVGVNVPIRTVLFTQLCKYDGEKTAILTARDFHQIGGRAGRKGFDEEGFVVAQAPAHVIENKRLELKKQMGKKVVKKQPPERGFVNWDQATFERLQGRAPEPLESRFEVTYGLLTGCLQSGGGYRRLVEIIGLCHDLPGKRKRHRRTAAAYARALLRAGIVVHRRRDAQGPGGLEVSAELQADFSINHTLTLYLISALEALDAQSPSYALDVLSLVEAILENPDAVLRAQLDELKGQKIAELKAQGMEYEERMAELEKLEYPKPNRELIYETFNAFAAAHPWVGDDAIRPKSVARQMFEMGASFNEYVRHYALQRSEGVLLRYLTDVVKTLYQSVPETRRDALLEDVISYLRTLLRHVDSSLLDEWERLRSPDAPVLVRPDAPEPPRALVDPLADKKGFLARVRSELHHLVRALALRDHEEAARALARPDDWTPEALAAAMAPYWKAHPGLDTTPRARRPELTVLKEQEPRLFSVRQVLVDPQGDNDWMLDCEVDLRAPRPDPDAPLVQLVRVGT